MHDEGKEHSEQWIFPSQPDWAVTSKLLRVGCGVSQRLARDAGVSPQQPCRVMTGKSHFTDALRQRLADVLRIDSRELMKGTAGFVPFAPSLEPLPARRASPPGSRTKPACMTLRSLPSGDDGRALERTLPNGIEEVATARGMRPPPAFFELRRLASTASSERPHRQRGA